MIQPDATPLSDQCLLTHLQVRCSALRVVHHCQDHQSSLTVPLHACQRLNCHVSGWPAVCPHDSVRPNLSQQLLLLSTETVLWSPYYLLQMESFVSDAPSTDPIPDLPTWLHQHCRSAPITFTTALHHDSPGATQPQHHCSVAQSQT